MISFQCYVPLCFQCVFGLFIPILWLYSHNLTLLYGYHEFLVKWLEYTNFIADAYNKSSGSSYFGAWADFH